mmetsp:Transcript_35086/g.26201  ORF Transcript_35086/g.26201 Transcript_35086/m.26201 type:complete len:203 (+) Transcript_35086:12-620(+)
MYQSVVFVGSKCVGKSSLIGRLTEGSFSEEYMPTQGVDSKIATYVCTQQEDENEVEVKLSLWDTVDDRRLSWSMDDLYRKADAFVIMFDLTDKASFEAVEGHLAQIMAANKDQKVPKVLVGSKKDLKGERKVKAAKGEKVGKQHKMSYFEVSAENGEGIQALLEELVQKTQAKKHLRVSFSDVQPYISVDMEDERRPQSYIQ